jgi:uncharacterized protein (TIGR02996 family)
VKKALAPLEAALVALRIRDEERALEQLVRAWNVSRARPLVALIDAVAAWVEPRRPPIVEKTAELRYQACVTIMAEGRQADLGRLVAVLPLLAYGDDRTVLDHLLYHWPHTPRMATLLDRLELRGLQDRVDELREAHAAVTCESLEGAAGEALAKLVGVVAAGTRMGEELLAQIYAHPEDDDARLVYADLLQERGDPRGELIALQFARRSRPATPAETRKERALLASGTRRWLNSLGTFLEPRLTHFERGFLQRVYIRRTPSEPTVLEAPEWATVEEVDLDGFQWVPVSAFSRLPSLREVRGLSRNTFEELLSGPPSPLRHVGYDGRPLSLAAPWSQPGLPALRSLGIGPLAEQPARWEAIWDTPIGRRIETVELAHGLDVASWLAARWPASITTLTFYRGALGYALRRDDRGSFSRLTSTARFPARIEGLQSTIDDDFLLDLPPDTLTTVTLAPEGGRRLLRLETRLRGRHPRLGSFAVARP